MAKLSDFAVIGPKMQSAFGFDTISKALKFIQENQAIVSMFLGLISQFTQKKQEPTKPAETAPPPQPAPGPVSAPPVPAQPTPRPTMDRKISGVRIKYFWINRKNNPFQEGGGRKLLEHGNFKAILSRADPLQAGDRVCVDATPFDQFGVDFQPNDPVNNQLVDEAGDPRLEWTCEGGVGEFTSMDDDFGCTPVFLVPWKREDIKPGFQGELGPIFCKVRGTDIQSNILPPLRVKPWAA